MGVKEERHRTATGTADNFRRRGYYRQATEKFATRTLTLALLLMIAATVFTIAGVNPTSTGTTPSAPQQNSNNQNNMNRESSPPTTSTYWASTYGGGLDDYAYSVQQTSDGGYVVAGYTESFGAGLSDVWVLKLDSAGSVEWQKAYGGIVDDCAYSVQQTSDGGYIVAGYTESFGGAWVLKLDSAGSVVWQKTYGSGEARSVQQTADGGYIIAGSASYSVWVMKLDSAGSVIWQKIYRSLYMYDHAYSVQQTSDGGYIVAGDYNLGFSCFWFLKLDSAGSVMWHRVYSDSEVDRVYCVQQTSDGGYIATGYGYCTYVFKLDSSGSIEWQRSYLAGIGYSIRQTSDGGYIVAGGPSWFFVWKLDQAGSMVWQKTYGGSRNEGAYSVQETADGGYVAAGSATSFGAGGRDVWVVKLGAEGDIVWDGGSGASTQVTSYAPSTHSATESTQSVTQGSLTVTPVDTMATARETSATVVVQATAGLTSLCWAKTYGGSSSHEYARSIQETSDGGYILAGYTKSFGAGGEDAWVLKLNSAGSVTWQKTYGGGQDDEAYSIQQTLDGGYIVAGATASSGAGGKDLWVLRLSPTGSVTWQKTYGGASDDAAYSIQQISITYFVVAGYTYSSGAGGFDIWVLKLYMFDGSVAWQNTYGGSNDDFASSIQQTSDGGYILAGNTRSFGALGGFPDGWLLKLDSGGSVVWQKRYGGAYYDYLSSIQQTPDGGYVAAGSTESPATHYDDWVLKLNSTGDVTWQKTYGGPGNDFANAVWQTSDGGYIISGITESFGAGGNDFWVLKLDSAGSVVWQNAYGGAGNDQANCGEQTADGGYIAAGQTTSFGAGGFDVWVVRLTAGGDIVWYSGGGASTHVTGVTPVDSGVTPGTTSATATSYASTIGTTAVAPQDTHAIVTVQSAGTYWARTYGGRWYSVPYSIQQTSDGGYIVAGYTDTFNMSNQDDFWVLKLSSSGSVDWQKTYGRSADDIAYCVKQTADGGYIVAGYGYSIYGSGFDVWFLKLDSTGSVDWQKAYGGTGPEMAYSVRQTSDGGYIVAGYTDPSSTGHYDAWVLKLDSAGSVSWNKTYGGTGRDEIRSIQQTSEGGYIVAGDTNSSGAGGFDFWVMKLDGTGSPTWQKVYGGSGNEYAYSVQQTTEGGYIVAGFTTTFGAGPLHNAWVLKLDATGTPTWQKSYTGSGNNDAYSVQQTSEGGYVIAGSACETSSARSHVWVLKVDSTGSPTWWETFGPGTNDYGRCVQQTSDGGYVVAAEARSLGVGFSNVWVIKLAVGGAIVWDAGSGASTSTPSLTTADSSATMSTTSATVGTRTAPAKDTTVTPYDTRATIIVQSSGDTIPPAAITDLTISGSTATSITLSWTAPGDDEMIGIAKAYVVKYSKSGPITSSNWGSATTYPQSWTPLVAGLTETHIVGGLKNDTKYWFAVKAYDKVPNYGNVSNSPSGATVDAFPPATITDLATSNPAATNVTLTWTAPGDNGTLGTAAAYIVKYSASGPINASNWDSATTYTQSWTPLIAGSAETHVVLGLSNDDMYWFAVEAYDEVFNYGGVSNSPSGNTPDNLPPAVISDLVTSNPTIGSVMLTWTAVGDNGTLGAATRYVIKYSASGQITDANWGSATTFTQSWMPLTSGSTETHVVTGLDNNTQYWFAIKAYDEADNYGGASNSPSATTATVHRVYWAQTYGGSTGEDGAYCAQQTSDGGYIVAGYTDSFGTNGDIWVLKLDSMGSVTWQKTYGGDGNEGLGWVRQTSDGGYIVVGFTNSFNASSGFDAWVLKLDSAGSVLWQKTYGGYGDEFLNSVQQTSDGGYIVAGWTSSFGDHYQDIWVLKLNAAGGVTWQKTYGGDGGDDAFSVQQTSDGGYIVAARTTSFSAFGYDILVLKLSASGSVDWQRVYAASYYDFVNSIQQTSDGGYIVAGSVNSSSTYDWDCMVMKLSVDGSVDWQKTYGSSGSEFANSIQQTADGGYIVAGVTDSFGAGGYGDIWVLKLNPTGSVIWQNTYGGSGYDGAYSVQQTSDGGYVLAGYTDSFALADFWVVKLPVGGDIVWIPGSGASTTTTSITPVDSVLSSRATSVTVGISTATVADTTATVGDTYADLTVQASCDAVPPAAITSLSAIDPTETSITLTWTAPGDDGYTGTAAGYVVKYSTSGPIIASNWASATTYTQSWVPLPAGSSETHVISGLSNATKYWFAVETYDSVPNYGGVSNSPSGETADAFPPAAITDLAVSNPANSSITLTWTAPGDNGTLGTAAGYIIKYSTSGPITALTWASATNYTQLWTPLQAGSTETHTVTGLSPATSYWFAIKAYDGAPNYGGVSNSPTGTTTGMFTSPPEYFGEHGFALATNATNFVVIAWTAQPPGTGAPSSGLLSYTYLDMTGGIPSGSSAAFINIYFYRARVQQLGLNETTLRLYRWDSATSQWLAIPSTVTILNSTHGVITASLNDFSYFAVLGTPLPTGGGGAGAGGGVEPLILVAAGGIIIALVVIIVAVIAMRRKGKGRR